MSKIRVLVADDSALMRKVIPNVIGEDKDIEVIGTAFDGQDAVHKAAKLDPDVITMDLQMPNMDGHSAIKKIMADHPRPILVISSFSKILKS